MTEKTTMKTSEKLSEMNKPLSEVAKKHKRTVGAIESRIKQKVLGGDGK